MKRRTRHALYWLAWACAFGAYELYAYLSPETGDTLSENVWDVLMLPSVGPVLTAMLAGFLAWLSFHLIAPSVWHHWQGWKDRRITPTQEAKMFVPAKAIWKSKTVWFNAAGAAVLLAEYLQTLDLGEPALQVVGGVLVVGNYILRLRTKQPVTTRGKGGKHVEADTV